MRRPFGHIILRGQQKWPHQRRKISIWLLAGIEGVPYQEVADICNVPLGTVKSRLSRARARLRDLLMQRAELLPQRYRLENDIDGR